jgi:uncharacterized protein (TIGR00369 family)
MSDTSQIVESVKSIFLDQIPFNKLLGMKIESLDFDSSRVRIDMREELVGNFIHGMLHGGVISSVLDVTGGLAAFMSLLKRMGHISNEERVARLSKFGTLDMRVDFLNPGRGKFFIATATVLRTGNKVAVTRMELHNDENLLIAVGTATYMVV